MNLLLATLAAAAATASATDVDAVVEVTDISSVSVSPDRRWLAYRLDQPSIARNAVLVHWAVVPADGSAPPRVVASGGLALSNGAGVIETEPPLWLPDSSGFLFRAHIDGHAQVWRAGLVGDAAVLVTRDPGDVIDFHLIDGAASIRYAAGASRALTAAVERRIRDSGARIDGRLALSIGAVGGFDRGAGPASVRMSGEWFDREPLVDKRWHWEQPLRGGPPMPLAKEEEAAPARQSQLRTVASLAEATCRLLDCARHKVSATVPLEGRALALITTTDSAQRQTLRLLEGGRLRTLLSSDGLLSGSRLPSSPCAVTASSAFCVAAGPTAPPRLVRIDLADAEVTTLHAPNAALASSLPGVAERLAWRDSEGNKFAGVLVRPRGRSRDERLALVIQYYGCTGFLRGGVGDELPYQALAGRGLAVLCIQRLRDPGQGDRIDDYRAAQGGIEAIVAQLAASGAIDPERVGMHGLSFGSEIAMWMARRTDMLKAASIASGLLEPAFYWFESLPGRDTPQMLSQAWGLGEPGGDRWPEIAPALEAERIDTPILMQLPESEARWSIQLITRLARAGKPFEAFVFPDAGHIKFLPRQKQAAYERNLEWFGFWLTGAGRPSVDDPERIDRWRAMAAALTIVP